MFKFSKISSLQAFQLIRYASLACIGIGFAKLRLEQSIIGQFETFVMMSGMVSFFGVSGIINAMLSVYPKKSGEEQEELLFNTFLALLLFSIAAGLALISFSDSLLSFLNRDGGEKIVPLSVLYLILNNPSFLLEYILYLQERKKSILLYAIIFGVATLAAPLIPALLHLSIFWSMAGLMVVAAVKLGLTLIMVGRFGAFRFNRQLLWQCFTISLPLIASLFVTGSAEYIDGLIVKAKFDNLFFSIYRYGARELPVLLIIANTLSSAMVPAIAANLETGLKELKERSAKLMYLFFPLTYVLLIGSSYIYKYVFSESFIYSAQIFNIYLLLIISRVLFPQTILTGLGKNRWLLVSAIIEIIINVSLSVYLAGTGLGLAGIAIGTFVAYLFDKVFLMAICYFVCGIAPARYVKLIPYIVFVMLTFVALMGSLLLAHKIAA